MFSAMQSSVCLSYSLHKVFGYFLSEDDRQAVKSNLIYNINLKIFEIKLSVSFLLTLHFIFSTLEF